MGPTAIFPIKWGICIKYVNYPNIQVRIHGCSRLLWWQKVTLARTGFEAEITYNDREGNKEKELSRIRGKGTLRNAERSHLNVM